MAQTETLMLIGLGFALAMLLVFAFGRGIWSMSGRYAKRQREHDLPAEMLNLRAERDRMRAEHAVMSRRLEAVEEITKANTVMKDAEIARQRNRVLNLDKGVMDKDAELTAKSAEVSTLTDQIGELAQSLEVQRKATNTLTREIAAREKGLADLHTEIDILRADLNDRKSELAEFSHTSRAQKTVREATTQIEASALINLPLDEPGIDEESSSPVISLPGNPPPGRFNFDRPRLHPVSLATPMGTDVNDVIKEARRNLTESAQELNSKNDNGKSAEGVISLAKRLRDLQAKSDEKISKTLK
jgi:hypothetical protein